jgi:dUTPase
MGISVNILVDTGACVTVLKRDIFNKLPPSSQDMLKPVNLNLVTATGETSAFLGKLNIDMNLGNNEFNHEVLIGDIQNDGILGVDFLTPNRCDVLLSKSCLSFEGKKIPCFHFNKNMKPTVCRISVAQDIVVPPEAEVIILGELVDPVVNTETAMVSAISTFAKKTGLLMAYGLVKPENECIPLRLMNTTDRPCKVKKNTIIAKMENVDTVETQINIETEKRAVNEITASDELPAHLTELYDKNIEKVSPEERRLFKSLLLKYQDAFSKDSKDIGTTNLVEHTIDTGDARPIRIPPRRIPLAKIKQAEDEIKEMADGGIIEPCHGPWSFPVVLIPKPKDNSIRFCIDYRRLNDSHPLPRIDDTLDALSGAKLFSVLDLKSAYWNVKIARKDIAKTPSLYLVVGYGSLIR